MLPIMQTIKKYWNEIKVKFGKKDPNMWSKSLEPFPWGDYSFAVVRGNDVMEDHSQVEVSRNALFVGVYDGHGGAAAASYVNQHLFDTMTLRAQEAHALNENIVRDSIIETENNFIQHVKNEKGANPAIVTVGTCCLIGLLYNGQLIYANLGDSSIVILSEQDNGTLSAVRLTTEQNVSSNENHREQYMEPRVADDEMCVQISRGTYRVKGIIQVTHSIGDAYMKEDDCQVPENVAALGKFRIPEPVHLPYLTATPEIGTRVLNRNDRYIIFASDGLWHNVRESRVAEIVTAAAAKNRKGIAKELVNEAVKAAAAEAGRSYKDVIRQTGSRRSIHDDITVVVVFIARNMVGRKVENLAARSVKPNSAATDSTFSRIEDL